MKRFAKLSVVALIFVAISSATLSEVESTENRPGDFASAFSHARRELLQGNYLTAIGLIRPFALAESPQGPPRIRDANAFQIWNQMQAMVTGLPSPLKPDATDPPDEQTVTAVAEASSRDALSAIADGARSTRVVILNENHDTPCQRAFAARVAETLRPLGYDTLALEALATTPSSTSADLGRRGYPVYSDGYYTRDPVFAAFIRRSLQLGYAPLAYEYNASETSVTHADRERGQAENLARYLSDHPNSKIFVYSGGGHLAEQPLADGSKMMGQWLRDLSGIDPLTIDQNRLQPNTTARQYLIKNRISSDMVLYAGDTPIVVGNLAGKVDMQILPADLNYIGGRPNCLLSNRRRSREIKLANRIQGRPALLQVFDRNDGPAAVPLDQAVILPGMSTVTLFLPRVQIRYVWKN